VASDRGTGVFTGERLTGRAERRARLAAARDVLSADVPAEPPTFRIALTSAGATPESTHRTPAVAGALAGAGALAVAVAVAVAVATIMPKPGPTVLGTLELSRMQPANGTKSSPRVSRP
jgi:hypothetical protein